MIAQDTGSAIVGPARAGAGDDAGRIASRIRERGRFVILLPRETDMVAAGKAMPLPQPKPPIPHEMVGNKGEGDRAHGNQKDRTKLTEKTQADKAPIRYAQKAEDHKKSLSSLRQQAEPASKGMAQLRSHETAVNKGEGDRPHGNSNDSTKLAEKTQAGKVPIGNTQKTEDHKRSLSKLHQQAQPPTQAMAKPHSDQVVATEEEGTRPHGYQKGRAKLAEKTEAEKAPIRYAQKAVKSLVDERQQEQPARKGTVKPRPEGVLNKEDGERQHGNPNDRTKLAEKTQAGKAPIGNAQKAEDHKKSLTNLRQQTHPASKATANSRS